MDYTQLQQPQDWRFYLGDLPEAWRKDFDDTGWHPVCVPHDWAVAQPFSRQWSSGTGYAQGGTGWYRHRFYLPEEARGKHITVRFDGVYKNSFVWCNSYYLGNRPNGWVPFAYDISAQACFGQEENVLCVKVEHPDVADCRWYTGSGITRPVTVVVEEAVHTAVDGVFFATPQVSAAQAQVTVETAMHNDAAAAWSGAVRHVLKDEQGNAALTLESALSLPAGARKLVKASGTVEKPRLWSPESPYLYVLETYAVGAQSCLLDRRRVGVRAFAFDADKGFSLNGVSTKLKGVCVHDDAGCLGAAVPAEVWRRRLEKLKAMGCNAVRMSHNPHAACLYDLCDEMGFLVMDEAFDEWEAPKNKWSTGHNVYPPKHEGYALQFPTWHKRDLQEQIRHNRNHPCILMWSIGNEIDYPNDPYCHPLFTSMTGNNDAAKPAAERQYNPAKPNAERLTTLCAMLCEEAREADPTRPITLAAAFPELSMRLGFLDPLDVAGYNYKEHLYAESRQKFPHKPFLGSENSHSLAAWRAVTDNDAISGQFLWTGIDYLGEAHGWPIRGSGAGLLTTAGFEKPGYYRRQALWATAPVLHLVTGAADRGEGEWKPVQESWNYACGQAVEVRCYTNLHSAELFLNGESQGVRDMDAARAYLSWTLPFAPGELTVRSGRLADSLYTVYAASQMALRACPAAGIAGQRPSLLQVEVEMRDCMGRWVSSDASMLHVQVQGGALVGLENGDLSDVSDYASDSRRAYHGRLLLYLRPQQDSVRVTVRSENAQAEASFSPFACGM